MPPFSPRQPRAFLRLVLADRGWLAGFATETAGWLVYVAALRLAPIALVQAVGAAGIPVLACATARGHPSRLRARELLAVAVAFAGLVALALSLVGSEQPDRAPHVPLVAVWLVCTAGAAAALGAIRLGLARGPALGLAAGLLFSGGDISAKLVVIGGGWLAAGVPLIACYALGSGVLQRSFQYSDALTAAGLATLSANALPIASGFIVFGERLPRAGSGTLELAAFACLVVAAATLARPR